MTQFNYPRFRIHPTTHSMWDYAVQIKLRWWLPWWTVKKTDYRDSGKYWIDQYKNQEIL